MWQESDKIQSSYLIGFQGFFFFKGHFSQMYKMTKACFNFLPFEIDVEIKQHKAFLANKPELV